MEYWVVATSISSRRMARHWLESVVVNAQREQLEANSQALEQLTSMLKGPLLQGDVLKLAATQSGVEISLNGLDLGHIEAPGLLALLMQTWLGSVPPSSSFRAAILSAGQPFEGLLSRYRNTTTDPDRLVQIEQIWLAPAQPEPYTPGATEESDSEELQTVFAAQAQSDGSPNPVSPVEQPPTQYSAAAVPPAAQSLDALPAEPGPAATTPSAVQDPPTQLALAGPVTAGISNDAVQGAQLPGVSHSTGTPGTPPKKILANKDYYDAIKRKIYQEVTYPTVALRNGRESEVALRVSIDPSGELIDVEISDESRFKYFNKAALRAVQSASPFSPPPKLLVDNGLYQFKMQVNFRLSPSS